MLEDRWAETGRTGCTAPHTDPYSIINCVSESKMPIGREASGLPPKRLMFCRACRSVPPCHSDAAVRNVMVTCQGPREQPHWLPQYSTVLTVPSTLSTCRRFLQGEQQSCCCASACRWPCMPHTVSAVMTRSERQESWPNRAAALTNLSTT